MTCCNKISMMPSCSDDIDWRRGSFNRTSTHWRRFLQISYPFSSMCSVRRCQRIDHLSQIASRRFSASQLLTYLPACPRLPFQDLRLTFTKVSELLQLNLNNPTKTEKSELPTLAQTAIDLTNIMIPFLPPDNYEALWNLFLPLLRLKDDSNMQRRAYRCLARLAEVEDGKQFIVNRLDQVNDILKYTDTHTTSQKVL
jgi:hypothetical protein